MKKILFVITALVVTATQGVAQKFIDVYQNDKVVGSMFSTDIDSVSVTGSDISSRQINFWNEGNLINSYFVNTIDSIKVFHSEDEPWIYLGILGFNQEIYIKPIDILANSTSYLYSTFVDNLNRKDGTLLYYGVENALDMFTQYIFDTPINSVNLITFTDGLDQGSLMMTSKYQEESEYLSDLNHRISSTCVRGLPITAYCIGLRGKDVTNYTLFKSNLRQLASSDNNAIEVNNMSDVNTSLQEIADKIVNISTRQTISMTIPGQSNGTRVCFTFDGKSPENGSMYIEGVFNLSDRTLLDVTYEGIQATSGSVITGEQEGIFVTYTFTGLQRTDGKGLISTNNIHQYNQAKESTIWQANSEFTIGNIKTKVTHSGSAILLVLDCSSSLGSQFKNIQSYAKNFISYLAQNAASFSINAPTNVKATLNDDEKSVNVRWDAVKNAEYYSVFRSKSASSGFIKVCDSLTVTNWCDESPLQGPNYYRIYSMGHGLISSESNAVEIEITDSIGDGSYSNPYTVLGAIAAGVGTGVYVKAYIVGCVTGQNYETGATFSTLLNVKTNMLIADSASETNPGKCMPVQLPTGTVRNGLNLPDNPDNLGKEVLLYGNIEAYFKVPGIKSVTYVEINGHTIGYKP